MRLVAPVASFDHPLEMLAACHERMEDRLDTLKRLAEHLASHGCDEQAQQAAANVLRYFDTAGEHHHEDEELDLFPALARTAPTDDALRHLIDALRADHRVMRRAWQALRSVLQPIADGQTADLDSALTKDFTDLYRSHIAREEGELLPRAACVLGGGDVAALGAAMAQRRGVKR